MADAVTGPSASCVQAHNQQIENNRALVREYRAVVAAIDQSLPFAQDAYHAARGIYEGRYGMWDRAFSRDAADFYRRTVTPSENALNDMRTVRGRRAATADEIERITDGLEQRGPQKTGECARIEPNHLLQDRPAPGRPGSVIPNLPGPARPGLPFGITTPRGRVIDI